MAKKNDERPGEIPDEVCNYCNLEVPCAWTVRMGSCEYAMCKNCPKEAEKDFFSYRLRTPQDREDSKERS
jgi:hypothetical protein